MSDFGRRWRSAMRTVKEQLQMPGPNMALDREPVLIKLDRSRPLADVLLAPSAQQSLAPIWNQQAPELSEIFVLLAETESGDERHVEIYINDDRLGALTAADSPEFLAVIEAALGQPVVAQAIRDRESDGSWALHLYRPESA